MDLTAEQRALRDAVRALLSREQRRPPAIPAHDLALWPRLGEVGQAFLVTRPGYVLAEADVLAFCRERLANYKVPRRVLFRDALPRNASGKVLKRVLKEEA